MSESEFVSLKLHYSIRDLNFAASDLILLKMFILLIFQNMMAIVDVFLACMMRVGCGIGDWDM